MDTSINGQYPPDKSTSFVDDGQNLLETFWQKEIESIQNLTAIDFRNQELPLARIKKIMKLDEDVKMISAEAPILFAKAAEIFIAELSLRAWANTKDNKRRTLQRNDIAMAISKYDQFDFLIDIVPREEVKPVKRPDIANSNVITSDQLSYFFQVAQQQQQQQPQIQPGPGQPVQIVQASNQNQSFAISPQVFQVPGNSSTQPQDNSGIQSSPVVQLNASSESQANNSDKAAISSPIILSNVYNNSGEIVQQIPITLSSQQYQTLMQNQNSTQSQPIIINSQSLPVQTQYITNTGQVVQTIIPNNKFSSQREDNE